MKTRLSPESLFALRNHIPIDSLISHFLGIPCKKSDGHFRFLCPICQEFRSACNRKTNLARCFLCEKNFNPIDMVMISRSCSFLQAVDYLQLVLAQYKLCR